MIGAVQPLNNRGSHSILNYSLLVQLSVVFPWHLMASSRKIITSSDFIELNLLISVMKINHNMFINIHSLASRVQLQDLGN